MAKEDNSSSTNTIVGPGTTLHGNMHVKGSILVYGTIIGDVSSEGLARTAKGSLIKGDVRAKEAVIDGELDGGLNIAGRATLGSSAKVVGALRAELLVLEEGAQYSGNCKMSGAKISKVPAPKDGQSENSQPVAASEAQGQS